MTETNTIELTDTEILNATEAAALIADAPGENKEAFVPTDAAGVDWVLAKAAAARAEAKLIRENMELMARACERRAEHLEWKFGPALQTWARAELGEGKKKSVRLPHGVVGYRTKAAGLDVLDAVMATAWARRYAPAAIAERLDKKVLAEALEAIRQETGEVLDFAAFQPAEEVFYIK